jgi:hypothetical protein
VKGPSPAAEADYMHSLLSAITVFRDRLAFFTPTEAGQPQPGSTAAYTDPLGPRDPVHPLPNRDLDTGLAVKPGGYLLTDQTYAELLHRLTRDPSKLIPPGIKSDVQAYYSDPNAPITTKQKPRVWAQVQADLKTLAAMSTSTEPAPYPTYGEVARPTQSPVPSETVH